MGKRLQVNVSDEMALKLEGYAKSMGVSVSSFVGVVVGQHILNMESATKFVSDFLTSKDSPLLDSLQDEAERQEAKKRGFDIVDKR